MKTEDEARWNGAVSVLLLDHYPKVTVEVVGLDATPPTLFVRNVRKNSNNHNNNESTTTVRVCRIFIGDNFLFVCVDANKK